MQKGLPTDELIECLNINMESLDVNTVVITNIIDLSYENINKERKFKFLAFWNFLKFSTQNYIRTQIFYKW